MPFCVIDRPFVIWGEDIEHDNAEFLEGVDSSFYLRAAKENFLVGEGEDAPSDAVDDQDRKDASSLSRMLWHHGVETLVMMLGAYVQAPAVVHGYFMKCRTEDAIALARAIVRGERPAYNRITEAPFTIKNLMSGIHRCAGWSEPGETIERFSRALRSILSDFADEEHRWEYNSIKHGLRASHGRFAIAFGIQEAPGIPAPSEAMETIGFSRDASFFNVAKPLAGATKQASKVNFKLEKVAVAWSLEKVVCELQLLSILIGNAVSALRIAGGAQPGTVTFNRPGDAEDWWKLYFSLRTGNIPTASFGVDIDARGCRLPAAKYVFDSYRQRGQKRSADD